jgi:hypothetical protein
MSRALFELAVADLGLCRAYAERGFWKIVSRAR